MPASMASAKRSNSSPAHSEVPSQERGACVVTLEDSTPLHQGDLVAYEFVSADRQWRWALGSVAEVHGPRKSALATGVLNTPLRGPSLESASGAPHMLVNVHDWAVCTKGIRSSVIPRRVAPSSASAPCDGPTNGVAVEAAVANGSPAGEKIEPSPPPVELVVGNSVRANGNGAWTKSESPEPRFDQGEVVVFARSYTQTTTTRASVFCKVVGVSASVGDRMALPHGTVEAIIAAACDNRRSPSNGTSLQRATVEAATLVQLRNIDDEMDALIVAEQSGRRDIGLTALERLVELWRIHIACVMENYNSSLLLAQNEVTVMRNSSLEGVAASQPPVSNGTAAPASPTSADLSEVVGPYGEGYLLARSRAYAEELERTRFQLRQREAADVRAADVLLTAVNMTLELRQPPDVSVKSLLQAIDHTVDMLVGVSEDPAPPARAGSLPGVLREDMLRHFRPSETGGGIATSNGHAKGAGQSNGATPADAEQLTRPSTMSMKGCSYGPLSPSTASAASSARSTGGGLFSVRAAETAVSDISAPTLDSTSPRQTTAVTTGRKSSGARCEELRRQEEEIVRLTAELAAEREERAALEAKVRQVSQTTTTPSEADRTFAATPSGSQMALSEGRYGAVAQDIQAAYSWLSRRTRRSIAAATAAVETLQQQLQTEAADRGDAPADGDETNRALQEKRLAIVRRQLVHVEAEASHHTEAQKQLRQLRAAIAQLMTLAQQHDERWDLPPMHLTRYDAEGRLTATASPVSSAGGEWVVTSHEKVMPGCRWETCVRHHPCRTHEAAVHDVAAAAHVRDSAIVRMRVEPNNSGLRLSFDIAHESSVAGEAIDQRLRTFPFRSLVDLYENQANPPEGSDALFNELCQMRTRGGDA